jgi:hypothetical protein
MLQGCFFWRFGRTKMESALWGFASKSPCLLTHCGVRRQSEDVATGLWPVRDWAALRENGPQHRIDDLATADRADQTAKRIGHRPQGRGYNNLVPSD